MIQWAMSKCIKMIEKIKSQENNQRLSRRDPNSFSNIDEAKVVDVFLQLEINFEKEILHGAVTLTVERKLESATHLVLDSRDLNVTKAINEETGELLDFELGPKGYVGSKLEIRLPNKNSRTNIKIEYSTSEASTALQWLPKEQTAGKTHPYLFSQCQAIHCRSMIPCQDTPSVKTPYSAEITAPGELTVLMSAIRQGEPEKNRISWKESSSIPSENSNSVIFDCYCRGKY